jgi:predicted nucleic acid-binding protein
MNTVFLDTVGLVAVWDEADQWHAAAATAFAQIMSERRPFMTTRFILLECGNMAARRPYRNEVSVLRKNLELRDEIIVPTEPDWLAAWEAYDRGEAGQAGIVDHVSFQVMRRLGITEAFTNDKHYQAAGFTVLF